MQPPIRLILGIPLSIFLIRISKQRIGQDIFTDSLEGFFIPKNILIVVALPHGRMGRAPQIVYPFRDDRLELLADSSYGSGRGAD